MKTIVRTVIVNLLTWSSLAYAQKATIQTSPQFKIALHEHMLQSKQALQLTMTGKLPALAKAWREQLIPANRRLLNSVKDLPPVYAMDLEVQSLLVKYDKKLRAELYFFQKPTAQTKRQSQYFSKLYSSYVNQVSKRARPGDDPGRSIASEPAPPPAAALPAPKFDESTPAGRAYKLSWEFAQLSIEAGGMLTDIGTGKYTVEAAKVLLRDHLPVRLEKIKQGMIAVKGQLPGPHAEEIGDHIRVCDLELKFFFQAFKLLETNDQAYATAMKITQKEIEQMTERQKARNIKRQVASTKAKFT